MKISVIIPTYNRARQISNVLEELCQQTLMPDEVVVVSDGSTDDTVGVVSGFLGRLPLKILSIANGGRSVARNTGVRHSSGELIVFFDDDMRPMKDCLMEHHRHHIDFPGSLITGAIHEDPELFITDVQIYRLTLYKRKGWVSEEAKPFLPMKVNELYLAAANFSISRESFDKLGGFDENLRDVEDFDLAMRAFKAGFNIYGSHTKALAYHDDLITCKSYIHRQRQYYNARQKLSSLKPDLYSKQTKNNKITVSRAKKQIFSLFSNKLLVRLIDSGILRFMMPKAIRYPFYDLVIGGMSDLFPNRKLD